MQEVLSAAWLDLEDTNPSGVHEVLSQRLKGGLSTKHGETNPKANMGSEWIEFGRFAQYSSHELTLTNPRPNRRTNPVSMITDSKTIAGILHVLFWG